MVIYYIYLVLLLLILILLYYGIEYSINFAPLEVKILSLSVFIVVVLRYTALIILLLARNIKYLYMLKPFVFLNLLCIPIVALISLYILSRNDKLRLNYCITVSSLLLLSYIFIISVIPANITYLESLGYVISLQSRELIYGIYLALNTIILFSAVVLQGRGNMNRFGMILIIISAVIQVIELLIRAIGISLLPTILIGDLFWIGTGVYSLFKLKRY